MGGCNHLCVFQHPVKRICIQNHLFPDNAFMQMTDHQRNSPYRRLDGDFMGGAVR